VQGEAGLPQAAIDQGIGTSADWQTYQQQQLSNQQITAQKEIAQKTEDFNQEQFDYQKQQADEQTRQAQEQSDRQSAYDTSRAGVLQSGQQQIEDAFSKFSPDYFKNYTQAYMDKASGDIDYQQGIAEKERIFGLARRGAQDSQSGVNQAGLLSEDRGRALAEQSQNAIDAANTLQTNTSNAKSSLLGQVSSAANVASPIAGGNTSAVNSAIDTTRNAISGVTNQAGDVTASLQGVPTVQPLSNVFGNVLSAAGSYQAGSTANSALGAYKAASQGLLGTSPFSGSSSGSRSY
jgi:hypothetical protein